MVGDVETSVVGSSVASSSGVVSGSDSVVVST